MEISYQSRSKLSYRKIKGQVINMAKKKKRKNYKGFGGVIVPVFLTLAIMFSLGYIGKQSLEAGGVVENISVDEDESPKSSSAPSALEQAKINVDEKGNIKKETKAEKKQTKTQKEQKATQKPQIPQKSYTKVSIKKLLQTAIKPVGSTMFVMGGGWNDSDCAAGKSATTIGLSSEWKAFADKQSASYNHKKVTDRSLGLDGSGYIGWVLYNTLQNESGKEGLVFDAASYDEKLSQMGLGKRTPKEDVTVWRPGDIMCSQTNGFAYIVLGACTDGSVIFVCSSPPGVRICGTCAPSGSADSEAIILAEQIMNDKYGNWYRRYPDCAKDVSYLTSYDKFSPTNSAVFGDDEGVRGMSAQSVAKMLF